MKGNNEGGTSDKEENQRKGQAHDSDNQKQEL